MRAHTVHPHVAQYTSARFEILKSVFKSKKLMCAVRLGLQRWRYHISLSGNTMDIKI